MAQTSEKFYGESVALALEEIFNQAGHSAAIINDCDYTLGKGVRLCAKKHNITTPIIDDIGHVMATALKAYVYLCQQIPSGQSSYLTAAPLGQTPRSLFE